MALTRGSGEGARLAALQCSTTIRGRPMPRMAAEMPSRLAQAAFTVCARRGFQQATLDEIAACAGVTKGSLYSHYGSKHEVVLAACNQYYRAYQQRVHLQLATLADPFERLRRMLEISVRSCVVDRETRAFTTEIFALALGDEAVRASWAQFYDTVRQMYVGLVRAAHQAGRIDSPDPDGAVNLMLAALEGIKIRAVFEPEVGAADEQSRIVLGLLKILGHSPDSPRKQDE